MFRRLARVLFVALATVLPLALAGPASAQQGYLYGEQNFRNACRPPLKYAAGYRDRGGRYCRPPSQMGW